MRKELLLAGLSLAMCGLVLLSGCGPSDSTKGPDRTDHADLFADQQGTSDNGDASQESSQDEWTQALTPREFSFPRDHAAHKDYRIEWWYYTGNLRTADGRRFGYQLTFFRTGLRMNPQNPSRWTVRDLYTTHFAVSDEAEEQHHCFQRSNRGGVGLAGAATDAYRVWNEDWQAELRGDSHQLRAAEQDVELELTLTPSKAPVIHGADGLSQKGPTAGNASHYYSLTRMPTAGTLRIGGQEFVVTGESWMDHEFSTSFLEPGQLGWDWMSIQFDDESELMLYRMRLEDGSKDPFSSGSFVDADGHWTHLAADDFMMTPVQRWTSPATNAEYPLQWTVEVPSLQLTLQLTPVFKSQEMTTAATTGISYWEGAIDVLIEGKRRGVGYMELTGYIGDGLGSLFE